MSEVEFYRDHINGLRQQLLLRDRKIEQLEAAVTRCVRLRAEADKQKAEDEKAITEDWLGEIGFKQNRPCHVHGTPNCNWWSEKHQLEIWDFNSTGEWLWVDFDSVPMKTRRDLCLLIEWAGSRFK